MGGTLKLTVSQEWIDGMNWFLHDGTNSGKLKVIQWFWGGCGQRWAWPFSSWDPKICWMSLWIELIFCVLTVMQSFLAWRTSYSMSLIFKCQFTAVVLVKPLTVAGRILWNRVCPSFPPDICLGVFLELDH